jgi:predicted dehydrogenase
MDNLNVAIVGCGQIAGGYDEQMQDDEIRTHIKAYLNNKNTNVVAVCDHNEIQLNKFGKYWSIENQYTDYQMMLQSESIDILSVCTSLENRFDIIKCAADNGVKLIFCEKPIAETSLEAKKIVDYCKKYNVQLAVNYKRRWDTFHQDLKRKIERKSYGNVHTFHCLYVRGIKNYGTHAIDLIRFFFGEIEWVNAHNRWNEERQDPSLDAYIMTKSGIACNLISLDRQHFDIFDYTLVFDKKKIEFQREGIESAHYELISNPDYNDKPIFKFQYKKTHMDKIMKQSINQLANCILREQEPFCTGHDAYISLRVAEAIIRSSEKQKKIYI